MKGVIYSLNNDDKEGINKITLIHRAFGVFSAELLKT